MCRRFVVCHHYHHRHQAIGETACRKLRYDDLWPLTPSQTGGGSGRGHGCGGRSRSSPSARPKARVQRQQDEQKGFPKSTLVWLRAGIRAVCVSKEMLRKAFFVAAPMHLTECVSPPLCLCCVPSLSHYPFTPISVMFTGQNGTQPPQKSCLASSWYGSHVCGHFFTIHLWTLEVPSAPESARGEGLKGMRHRNEREKHQLSGCCQLSLCLCNVRGGEREVGG